VVTRQIEEQREGMEQALRDSEARTRALLDASPDMVFRLDREGRYLDFHARDETLLAVPAEEFMGRKLSDIFSPELANSFQEHINRACETKELQLTEYELPIQGVSREFEARFVGISETEVVGIVREITERKRAERQLRLTESRLNEAQRMAKIGSYEWNIVTGVHWWSEERYRMAGRSPETFKPSRESILETVHPEDRQRVAQVVDSALTAGGPYSMEFRTLLPDGSVRIIHSHGEVIFDQEGRPALMVGTAQDITERVELEREIVAAGENERNRVGRDLHDGLGQELTGISLGLKSLSQTVKRKQLPRVESVQDLTSMTQRLIAEVKRIAWDLSPGFSKKVRLSDALTVLAAEVREHSDIKCHAHCSYKADIHDAEVATHLYRIAQESINNALKHSGAQNIELRYGREGDSFFLEVLDDGTGIPPADDRIEGVGLRSMRYRARMLNGRLEVAPRTPKGTRVRISCPLQPD